MDYEDIVKKLPKPQTPEEQYMYSLICAISEVPYKEPFNKPVYRMEQYWKAFFEVMSARVLEPVVPDENTVGESTLQDGSVGTEKIQDNSIVYEKLSDDVKPLLLGEGKITEPMLENEVSQKLLGTNKITTSMLKPRSVTREKLSNELQESLSGIFYSKNLIVQSVGLAVNISPNSFGTAVMNFNTAVKSTPRMGIAFNYSDGQNAIPVACIMNNSNVSCTIRFYNPTATAINRTIYVKVLLVL